MFGNQTCGNSGPSTPREVVFPIYYYYLDRGKDPPASSLCHLYQKGQKWGVRRAKKGIILLLFFHYLWTWVMVQLAYPLLSTQLWCLTLCISRKPPDSAAYSITRYGVNAIFLFESCLLPCHKLVLMWLDHSKTPGGSLYVDGLKCMDPWKPGWGMPKATESWGNLIDIPKWDDHRNSMNNSASGWGLAQVGECLISNSKALH